MVSAPKSKFYTLTSKSVEGLAEKAVGELIEHLRDDRIYDQNVFGHSHCLGGLIMFGWRQIYR
jgi:hypothetical protein